MDIEIALDIDKEPYIKTITNDKVINLTGESGSGKSYFSNQWINDSNYIIIDTDIVFGNRPYNNKYEAELQKIFIDKYGDNLRNVLIEGFDECYDFILNYLKLEDKIIVIDSAQYRNMKDLTKLKGQIIIMRTCINTCYKRCLERYNKILPNATDKEKQKYAEKKKKMYTWYKSLNDFILKVDQM